MKAADNRKNLRQNAQNKAQKEQSQLIYAIDFQHQSWAILMGGECSHIYRKMLIKKYKPTLNFGIKAAKELVLF